jgi:large subunit ribosomal protein L10
MITKAQKIKAVETGVADLQKSRSVIIADFTGITVNEINSLRRTLKSVGAIFRVVKKRLLKFVFEKEGMVFDPEKFAGQTGVIFSPKDLAETAGKVYEFAKTKKDLFKFLGGFDVKEKKFIEGAEVKRIGQLPSREVLLGQIVGMLAAPIRKFMFVLNQKGRSNH